ncbi:tetratricopeptide repeat protein [Methylibium rhizosphaerae]|uniref:tetratricopeptide repeat protein n=1 Tax=Methylibium rhizosphaerae TaxID=2570323 RepID=UPI001126E43E|nr:tetratricopeptide repeat protein [Methylibium rhizosphaerae]
MTPAANSRTGMAPPVLLLALALALQGCTTAPQAPRAPSPAASAQGPAAAAPVTPQQQADLDAAMALVKAAQYDRAAEAFARLAAALPDNPIPPINLALVHKQQDKPELAEAQLRKALAIEPGNPVAGNELALLYRKAGRFSEARTAYEQTLAKHPHFAMAHKNLGVLCDLYLKDYACAIDHYQRYAESAPNDKTVQIWIADLQKRNGAKGPQ